MLVESHIKHSDQTSGMREGANFGRPRANFRPKFDVDLPTCFSSFTEKVIRFLNIVTYWLVWLLRLLGYTPPRHHNIRICVDV